MSLINCQETVTTELSTALSITATNEFTPEFDLKKMAAQKVVVVPVEVINPRRMNRGGVWEEMPLIHIGIGRRVQTSVSEKDILAIANTIREHFKSVGKITGAVVYFVMDVKFMPFYHYEVLDEDKLVLSIIEITFKEFTG